VTIELIAEAVTAGARRWKACELLGLSLRSLQRWGDDAGEDRRKGPLCAPGNKLSDAERREVLQVANCREFRDVPPSQIVPRLADRGRYVACESTFYRVLREEGLLAFREPSKPRTPRAVPVLRATAPNQVWSWDITYLQSARRGTFYYLYLAEDIWSRKVVGWDVHQEESMELAAAFIDRSCERLGVNPEGLTLHSDNGGPMKGSTMLAMLQHLGIVPSFSRPRVSDDNPFSEALFRTLKYRPAFPKRPFESIEQARAWVADFADWYNTEHRHSGIRFVTPEQRHTGRDAALLEARRRTYERAREQHPERWSRGCRNWTPVGPVELNPGKSTHVAPQLTTKVVAA
jgi:transposase InsO family protein